MNKLNLNNTADRTLPKILRAQAAAVGDSAFLVTDSQRITFSEADTITDALAAGLQKLGLQRDDRIALYMGNRPEMVLLALAANKLGAIWTPISTDYKGEWLLDTLQRSHAKVVATDTQRVGRIKEIQDQLAGSELLVVSDPDAATPEHTVDYGDLTASEPIRPNYDDQHYGDTCAILWTSGTTGKSKGVLQSHNCWVRAIVLGASQQYHSRDGDVIYCVLPLYNTASWVTCIFRALMEGLPCVIEPKFSVTQFWERVEHFGATQTFALGAMGMFLLNAPARQDDADTSLREALIVPMPPEKWRLFEERFGVRLLRSGLGMSECISITNQVHARDDIPVHALGFPPGDIEIQLCDDNGNQVPPGEPGEICIRQKMPHVLFNGYFNNPEATAEAYRGVYYLTGDIARQDQDSGAYFFVDRKKDAVRFAGRNISTLEVESVVRKHPAVQDVAAFGVTSDELESEQELKINIVLLEGSEQLSCEELCKFINDNAPHYFVPRYMEFVDSLPYTPTNKVQKFKLREEGIGDDCWDLKSSDYKVQR